MAQQKLGTMKAVVFHGPQKVAVEDRPVPGIIHATDVIVKATYTALCGRYEYLAPCFFFSLFYFSSFLLLVFVANTEFVLK